MQIVEYSKSKSTGLAPVLFDLWDGLTKFSIWSAFAWEEIKNRYRRSIFGLVWIVFSYIFFVAGLAVFFGGFSNLGARDFVIYVAVGFVPYTFITGNLSESPSVFVNSANWIRSIRLPNSVYIYIAISKTLLPFILQLLSCFLIIVLMGWRPTWMALWAIVAFGAIVLNAAWIHLLLGILGARQRDLKHLVNSILPVLFLTTPVMWNYSERTGIVKQIADLNPVTHMVEIFRQPLLGNAPAMLHIWFVLGFTITGWIVTLAVAAFTSRRLPLWVA